MGDKSQIQWCDATWNAVTGCSKVSPGCAHCYAETVADRFWKAQYPAIPVLCEDEGGLGHTTRPRQFTDVECHEDRLDQPLRWKRPRRVFVNSMSDVFHESVSNEFIDRMFAVMALSPQHTFQILTKRANRMLEYSRRIADGLDHGLARAFANHRPMPTQDWRWPLPNVWLGVSVENQHFLSRIDVLKDVPAALRFVSFEPLLEDLGAVILDRIGWCIVGGESGNGARPFDLAWARSIIKQCRAAGVPVFIKQLGRFPRQYGERYPLQLDKGHGGDPVEWPKALRVREFPEAPRA
jgi:protein gp37